MMKLFTFFGMIALSLTVLSEAVWAVPQKFRIDDPISVDRDDLPIAKPERRRINDYYDFLENTFLGVGDRTMKRAVNISTLGEVPDSSWYTNRIGTRALSREEIVRGANTGSGPSPGILTVVEGKTQGISPGFTIRDSAGFTYFLKFDPVADPELATAAEIISSKFFYALGYNVPENYLLNLNPDQLEIAADAKIRNELDEEIPLTREFIDALLSNVSRRSDGTIRAIASKSIQGEGIGPFKFYGTRKDDPNDVFPHEHRRELRGYYVFCSWLNHDDSRSVNTLDVFVEHGGGGYVKHYLIDFGSTLGSGSVTAQKRRPGNEYLWEAAPTFKSILSLGIWLRPWVMVHYPEFRGIGRFESSFFDPPKWKPEYPNPAFRNMDVADAFWAARQVMMFTEDDIRAVVATAELSDPAARDYLSKCIVERQNKVGAYWLHRVSSLDNFRIEGNDLVFEDLLVKHHFENTMPSQTVQFASLDNSTGVRQITGETKTDAGRVRLPTAWFDGPDGSYFTLKLSAKVPHYVEVFFRRADGRLTIVGVERE